MIKLIIRKFIKNSEQTSDRTVREAYCVLAGTLGIICNLVLFALKLTIGSLMNSIAIISDSFNNLSDIGSSAVSVIGAKMSNRRPDRDHPFGHGRVEYISALLVSFIILLVGFELIKSSFSKILHPEVTKVNAVLVIILAASILVKLWMYSYNKYMGKQINSQLLTAASADSLNDVIATSAVTASSVIGSFIPGFPLDGIAGLLVSLLIIKAGWEIAKDTIDLLLGTPPDPETVKELESILVDHDSIQGIHDLIIHDYGPGRVMASVHAEVPHDANIVRIHEAIDAIETHVLKQMGIELVIHMDPISVNCEKTNTFKKMVSDTVQSINSECSIHDFRITDGDSRINLIFDLVVPAELSAKEQKETVRKISERISELDSRCCTVIKIDLDYTGRA